VGFWKELFLARKYVEFGEKLSSNLNVDTGHDLKLRAHAIGHIGIKFIHTPSAQKYTLLSISSQRLPTILHLKGLSIVMLNINLGNGWASGT
jgi:hypothetical protein